MSLLTFLWLWEIKQEKTLSQESPDCEWEQEGKSNFIIISLIMPSSPLQSRRFGAFSVKVLGVWKVPGEPSNLGGVGSGSNSKTKSAHLQQDLCGKEWKALGPESCYLACSFFSYVRDFTWGFFQLSSYTFYTLELCRAQITFSKMERSVTCVPGIRWVFHVSLPWEVLKVSVFSLLCIKLEFLVRKKRCCGQSPKSYSFIYSLVTTYSNVAHH